MTTHAQLVVGANKRLPSLIAAAVGLALLGVVWEAGRTAYVLPHQHTTAPTGDLRVASLGMPSPMSTPTAHPNNQGHRAVLAAETVAAPNAEADLVVWSQARPLATKEARSIHEKNAPFIHHHLSGGWTSPITADNVLSRFNVDRSEVELDPDWIADEVRADLSDLRAEITWLTDQYFGIRNGAMEKLIAAEPAQKSRDPLPPSPLVRGGVQKISVDPSATGGWYVRYELRTADYPELFRLEQEIMPLVGQCNRRARRIVEGHQRAALAGR